MIIEYDKDYSNIEYKNIIVRCWRQNASEQADSDYSPKYYIYIYIW